MDKQSLSSLEPATPAPLAAPRGRWTPEPPNPSSSDAAVFAHFARTGCERSFQIVFERYRPRIRGFLVKRINDEVLADDLTQNIFVRILRNAHKFDPSRDFSKWAFTIVTNVLKNHYRSVGRDRMHSFTDLVAETRADRTSRDPVYDAPSEEHGPDHQVFCSQLRAQLHGAVELLEPSLREPFVLYQVEGNPYKDVAETLGLPLETVKHRTVRARTQLREVLAAFSG